MDQNADNHILEFVRSKFGAVDKSRFETQLYLCLPAFQPQDWEFYRILTMNTLVLPFYAFIVIQKTFCVALTAFRIWFVHPNTSLAHDRAQGTSSSQKSNVGSTQKLQTGDGSGLHFRKNAQPDKNKPTPLDRDNQAMKNSDANLTDSAQRNIFGSFLCYVDSSRMLRFVTHMDERPMQSFHICKP